MAWHIVLCAKLEQNKNIYKRRKSEEAGKSGLPVRPLMLI